ncbi:hypothetical protein ED28_04370 [[Pantoea] beijingensis]|uniref:Chromate transporter n=1 Tax=[Pantoea] beijingensis TaxID=1324864 RepID=A0A443IG57_9GAMM|nr:MULTISPECIES: chromate transporter [Erwiniaceae]RWR03039.1 hypothetical protein ED28_04370 [[Pantoea] beijingensis]
MTLSHLFGVIFLASILSFGGLSSLPILRGQMQNAGLPADTLLLHSLAIGNIAPGPNGLYLVVVGYFIGGFNGACVAVIALIVPPFLVIILERIRNRLVHLRRFRAVMFSLSLAVIAVLIPSSASLVSHAATDLTGMLMVAAGALLLLLRLPSLVGIALAIGVGFFSY